MEPYEERIIADSNYAKGYITATKQYFEDAAGHLTGGIGDDEEEAIDNFRNSLNLSWWNFVTKVIIAWNISKFNRDEKNND